MWKTYTPVLLRLDPDYPTNPNKAGYVWSVVGK